MSPNRSPALRAPAVKSDRRDLPVPAHRTSAALGADGRVRRAKWVLPGTSGSLARRSVRGQTSTRGGGAGITRTEIAESDDDRSPDGV